VASNEISLEVNVDKTKYIVMARDQNGGRSHSMKTLKWWKRSNIWEKKFNK
jgi:hypothetical protein